MADTIKTATILIEEGKLIPKSLQFESEPWTPFYMAGEIIRESRQASGKQNKYTSEGSMAHSDKVIDHYDNPCDVGGLLKDDANRGTGLLGAPECGDVMKLQIEIDSETQVIEETEENTEWVKSKRLEKTLAITDTNLVRKLDLPPCNPGRCNKILQNREATPAGQRHFLMEHLV